ncbi:MAG: hypothetical protein DRH24_08830 [Deltaproteobacteria bacterium]|nr:MAG: hypothetical protein DRH24_08830 [Deltaproteobacteria bacterium]
MDICAAGYLLLKVEHGSEELEYATSAVVTETSADLVIRHGTLLGPCCRPPIARDLVAQVECMELAMDIAFNTKADLKIYLQQANGTAQTIITCADMRFRDTTFNSADKDIATRTVSFFHEGCMSSEPISVAIA